MVGRSGAVEELSGSVDCGRSGELCGAVDARATESGAIPAGSGKVSPRSSEHEQRGRASARRWTRDAGAAAGVVAFSRRIRGDQLRTRYVAVPHAAIHAPRLNAPRFNSARFRSGIPFPERADESGDKFRRAVLSRPAEDTGTVRGKAHKHSGTDASLRRGTAPPTLVRETSQVGLVFGRLDRRHGNTGAGNARKSHHREGR